MVAWVQVPLLALEPYQIAHDPGSQPSSVGLGLAVARRLARLMEGSLTYERTGSISVFQLTLPLHTPNA